MLHTPTRSCNGTRVPPREPFALIFLRAPSRPSRLRNRHFPSHLLTYAPDKQASFPTLFTTRRHMKFASTLPKALLGAILGATLGALLAGWLWSAVEITALLKANI